MTEQTINVAGAGPVGMLAALGVADAGFPVVLVGPKATNTDRRTTALMAPSLAFLERLSLLDQLLADGAELRAMRIVDATKRLVRAPTVTFHASEIGEPRFGLNVANERLLAILSQAVSVNPRIERIDDMIVGLDQLSGGVVATLASGATVDGALLVAADGRNSKARELAGITATTRALPQAALVLNFEHTREHGQISTELHTETGPFTQVPLPGRRSSLVWVVSPAEAAMLSELPKAEISLRVETRMASMLGKVDVQEGRQVYPLGTLSTSSMAQARVALVGEAAHVFPPIGAQGLNLGVRDVEDLLASMMSHATDPGSDAALADYGRRRRLDVMARSTAVNLLNHSLLTEMLPAQLARGVGLAVLDMVPGLRGFFMREGLKPGAGIAALSQMLPRPPRLMERDRAAGGRP